MKTIFVSRGSCRPSRPTPFRRPNGVADVLKSAPPAVARRLGRVAAGGPANLRRRRSAHVPPPPGDCPPSPFGPSQFKFRARVSHIPLFGWLRCSTLIFAPHGWRRGDE
ncbi:hypothetical protein VM98_29575 [Streptomyces rubellomurinus subsp. indigoferus]|nr:hypothetical protein VM98_29575 [Streptomyces rubellomurinus subsp. indigoferus]